MRFFAEVGVISACRKAAIRRVEQGRFGQTPSGQGIRFRDGDAGPHNPSFDASFKKTMRF